jgi:DNA-binding MarR family transcriptional regulator
MFIGRKMMIINKYFKIYLRNALKEYDLNAMEGMVLLVLYENNNHLDKDTFDKIHNILGKTQEQIISELHYDKSIMARTMQSLEKKGLLLRDDNPHDNRSYIFTLTEKAVAFKPCLSES